MPTLTDALPLIGVLSRRTIRGLNSLEGLGNRGTELLQVLPINEAIERTWPTDAHFVTYRPYNASPPTPYNPEPWPRCNKIILPQMRTHGADLHATFMAFDYDRPKHDQWPSDPNAEGGMVEWLTGFELKAASTPLADWTAVYSTNAGFRLIYLLTKPVPVDRAEEHHRWLVQMFHTQGIKIDRACSDWTRIFRLPYVVRDDVPTWDAHEKLGRAPVLYFSEWQRGIDPDTLGSIEGRASGGQYAELNQDILEADKPPKDWCLNVMQAVSGAGKMSDAPWIRSAKKRLKGRECSKSLFEHQMIAFPGSRDNTLHRLVGQAISILYFQSEMTPDHIYAMFLGPVEQLDPDQDHPDWTNTLWDHVKRLWAKEDAKERAAKKVVEDRAVEGIEIAETVIDGMRTWCNHPSLTSAKSHEEALAWAHSKFIIIHGRYYHVMRPDGFYDTMHLNDDQLYPRIRELGMGGVIQTEYLGDNNNVKKITRPELLNRYGTVIVDQVGEPGREGFVGGIVRNIGEDNAVMVTPSYRRSGILTPAYDGQVDEWLKSFFDTVPLYDRAMEWIAWSLAFEEGPICGMSIHAPPGSGKQMLIRGLAECLENPALAHASDLVGNYNDGLMHSPFLWVNEGWPKQGNYGTGKHPADQFRSLVGGDPIAVRQMYKPTCTVLNPVRIIITANNEEVVRMLTGGRNLSPEDRDALMVRLVHFKCGGRATLWLKAHGGMALTGRPGARWVASPGTNESDFIVARHFLWLYQQRNDANIVKGVRGSRLLVEGDHNTDFMTDMRVGSGQAPLVVEAIIQMIESPMRIPGIVIEPVAGKVFITSSGLLNYYRANIQRKTYEVLNISKVSSVLRGLVNFWALERVTMGGQAAIWHELDTEILHRTAHKEGYIAPKLEALIRAGKGVDMPKTNGVHYASTLDSTEPAPVTPPTDLHDLRAEALARLKAKAVQA